MWCTCVLSARPRIVQAMRPRTSSVAGIAFAAAVLLLANAGRAAPPEPATMWKQIAPILTESCVECHGRKEQGAGLRLDRRADLLGEVRGKPVVVPGDPDAGRLIPAITGRVKFKKARLNEDHQLPAPEVAQLRAWIAAGAK
jgi:hypothetical protein